MKKILISLGKVVAILLMLSPLVVFCQLNNMKTAQWIFWLVTSVLYAIYMYSIISNEDDIEQEKEHYYKFVKDSDKKLALKLTYKEKYENLEKYIEDYFERKSK